MTDLSKIDHPTAPDSPGAWDAHSEARLESDAGGAPGEADAVPEPPPTPVGVAADPETGKSRRPAARRGAADPVKALMRRHRDLCEGAVDPLEIAAGLEAHGVTDRTAARFRHRDVFSLAEEMYARVPRDGDAPPPPETTPAPRARADWALLALLPGALSAATVTGLHLTHGRTRFLVAVTGALAVALGVRAALRRGPLSMPAGTSAWRLAARPRAWTLWLLGYAAFGDGLLGAVGGGGPDGLPNGTPDGPWPTALAPLLALAFACAPATWSAHLFAARARRRLAASRGLEEFTTAVQPLLLGAFALFLCALAALAAVCGAVLDESAAYPQTLSLGALLLLARLLGIRHLSHLASVALAAAAVAEAAAPALVLSGRLPGCAFLSAPVDTLVEAWGPGSVPALVCTVAALTLLFRATRTLTRASAHAPTGDPR
ncbi:hypothetical protein [Streptomyces sp. V3I7]|uniref:hypothetical protein n=1 Tax=Streptomyces sp. V3I7 TaxID=3042278 RepID=UPI00278125CD|nr:hypothetical protein [Streptomyces sp. V3I7]MDQ0992924.1 hypothetical protein [Streptomyces sp. V3I7]